LMARLFYSLRKRNVPIRFGTSLVDVLRDARGVHRARLRAGDDEMVVRTRRGVILATGGFGHNKELRQRFMPQPTPVDSLTCETDTGDGIAIGLRLGARTAPERGGRGGLWTPASRTRRRDGSAGLYPHLVYDRAKPGLLAVNSAGRRFVNEAVSYHDFVEAMFDSHASVSTIPAWLICASAFITQYGLGALHPGTRELR